RTALFDLGLTGDQIASLKLDGTLGQLRRRLRDRELNGPPRIGKSMAAVMLIRAWDAANEADRAAVATIGGGEYSAVEEEANNARFLPGSPLIRVGAIWKAGSAEESLVLIRGSLDVELITRFTRVAGEVLSMPDTRFDLPVEERWSGAL